MVIPDVASFTPIPFVNEGLPLVHCDPHVQGRPWPFAPRVILKSAIARADEAGELVTADPDDTAAQPCYDARGVTRMYEHLTSISEAMNALGWGNYANERTGAVSTSSGASWAPRSPTYDGNDRTHYVRIPDEKRIELRGGNGSANPYLAVQPAVRPSRGSGELLVGNSEHRDPTFADPDSYSNVATGAGIERAAVKVLHRFDKFANPSVARTYAGCYDVTPTGTR
jgi:hypothetical protein